MADDAGGLTALFKIGDKSVGQPMIGPGEDLPAVEGIEGKI